jgi:hypothetical protein
MSVLSFCEIIELIIELIHVATAKKRNKKNVTWPTKIKAEASKHENQIITENNT